MEKKKKWDLPHWVTPGVFSGQYVVDEAVERITCLKPVEMNLQKPQVVEKKVEENLKEQIQRLELELKEVKEQLAGWEKRSLEAEEAQTKERQHLYQVVLSLKKEWENERHAHRDH
ncbi:MULTISPECIES: hypothetical protein [Brevibacillus]|uniref:hypothetical protein n=1 Tax=Brevibacillus TaxID=55080 RepID=UPI00203AC7D7|nr:MULTISPECIES: hypothetical protein [Brevibacillus]MCM3077843.1 hypothetical protein [Brevibacillus invocatus]MCM3428083.1 hypothetical protein [Brevibacillus invocatus]MDH4616068.1 hypothetical protein [Brevibacillus sp. AY1]